MDFGTNHSHLPHLIQTHDNPDADSICSAYIVKTLLDSKDISSKIVYGGELAKEECKELLNGFSIYASPIRDLAKTEEFVHITVDCIPEGTNVTPIEGYGTPVATYVFDHHKYPSSEIPKNYFIDPSLKACTVLLYSLFSNQIKSTKSSNLYTAIYYGLQRDSNNFEQILDDLSLSVKSEMERSNLLNLRMLSSLESNCITVADLEGIYSIISNRKALTKYPYACYSVANDDTDPNILGKTADLIAGTAGIDIVVVAAKQTNRNVTRLSVRSYNRFFDAIEIVKALGNGGGHSHKAGGILCGDNIDERLTNYLDSHYLLEVGNEVPNLDYRKFKRRIGIEYSYIPLYLYFERGSILETANGKCLVVNNNVAIINPDNTLYTMTLDEFNFRFEGAEQQNSSAIIKFNNAHVALTRYAKIKTAGSPVSAGVLDKPAKIITHVDRYHSSYAKKGDILLIWDNGHIASMTEMDFESLYEPVS